MPILFMQAAPSNRQRAAHAATAVVAALAGWFAHQSAMPAPEPSVQQPRPRPAEPDHALPVIMVASDGNVTLRVEKRPLDWVLEQIAHERGRAGLRQPAGSVPERTATGAAAQSALRTAASSSPAAALPACPESAALQVDAGRVLQSIEGGTEAERFQGLMLARSAGLTVAEPLLKRLFESGDSERVQVAAFEAYLALRADRPDALRTALEQAQHAPAPSIQRNAAQRLAELAELQRLDTLPPLTDP